jgi:hypothetical protein
MTLEEVQPDRLAQAVLPDVGDELVELAALHEREHIGEGMEGDRLRGLFGRWRRVAYDRSPVRVRRAISEPGTKQRFASFSIKRTPLP